MKTKMNRILSLLLSFALIISLLPSVAYASGAEQKLEISEIITKNASTVAESVEAAKSALSWTGINVRRYGEKGGSGHRQFVALKVSVATPGKYNVYFKTNNPTETSIAPAIAIVKYNSAMDNAKNTNAIIETNNNLLGHFNFSAATAGEYAPVTKNGSADGEKITVELEAGDYCILFVGNLTSHSLNPYAKDANGKVVETTTDDASNKGINTKQEMYLSGIRIVPEGQQVSEDEVLRLPEGITADIGEEILSVGSSYPVIVTDSNGKTLEDGIELSYKSDDEDIATIDNSGILKPLAAGRAKITVTASLGEDKISTEFEVNIIGSNLLTFKKVNHGEFERDIYLTDKSNITDPKSSYWKATKNATTYNYEYTLLSDVVSEITGKTTNIAKFSLAPTGNSNKIRIQSYQGSPTSSSDHRNIVKAEAGKLYEYTGYIKSEKTNTLPSATMRAYYYNDTTSSGVAIKNIAATPWAEKTGDQDWTKFNVGSLYLNYGYTDVYGLETRMDFTAAECKGVDVLVSHISVHEVAFDRAELSFASELDAPKYGDTLSTALKLYSNTGTPITVGAALDSEEVKYTSSNEAVATVDETTGVVTVVSNGETTINVTVTINGVTRETSLPLNIGGVGNVISDVIVSADKTALNRGETSGTSYKLLYNDGTEYTGDSTVYYYESENPGIASVSQEGEITAKAAGNTNIILWIEADGAELCGTLPVAVADSSPLECAEIYGDNTVEAGFATRLSVKATHEGGKAANLDACDITFSLADEADAEYLTVAKNGEITGVKEKDGPVDVIVTVTCGEYKITSAEFPITVTPNSPKSQLIDFRKPGSGYAYNVSMEDYGWEINREETANMVGMVPTSKLRCYAQAVQAQITKVGNTKNAELAIDVWVNYTGWYDIDFRGVLYYRGADSAALYMDGKYMGDFNFWTDTTENRKTNSLVSLNTMYLTEGKHTFTIRALSASPSGSYAYLLPAHLSLEYVEGIGGMDEIILSADKTNLAVGETSALLASVIMQGGREYKFGNNYNGKADETANLTLVSSDTDVASIKNGVITAVSPGNATITATATIGTDVIEETLDITVNEETLSHFELSRDAFNIHVGSKEAVEVSAHLTNGERISNADLKISYATVDKAVAVYESGGLNGLKLGETEMTVTVTLGNVTLDKTVPVSVIADGFASVVADAVSQVIKTGGEGTDIVVKAYDNKGQELDISTAEIRYESSDEGIISVDDAGWITPVSEGVAEVTATVVLDGITLSASVTVSVRSGKVKSTYYTEERVANARENIQKYDWARDTAEAAIEEADKYLPYYDYIYNMIPAHTLPRAFDLVEIEDPEIWRCFYCGIDIQYNYGKYSWRIDAIARPWKIQCPDCKRLFPSNDFGAYYELGLDSHGEFDYTLAREENGILCGRGYRNEDGKYVVYDEFADNPYGYGDPKGNLYNETYTELYADSTDPWKKIPITQGWGDFKTGGTSGVPSAGYFWGVDDGMGYDTGRYHENGVKSVVRYIAVFAHDGLWYSSGSKNPAVIRYALNAFREAYVYTGDKKYGIAGAIILDRIADLYPDMDYGTDCPNLQSSHDGGGNGKVVGRIWENGFNKNLTMAYDAFFDVYDEPEVINYLSAKAEQWNLDNKKTNGEVIRQNAEKNLLEETYTALKNGQIMGNFGMRQNTLATAAIILDRQPETQEMIDFIYQTGVSSQTFSSGGNMRSALINQIDRDGYGDESSMGYLRSWNSTFLMMAHTLEGYPGLREEDDLLKNPKFIKMLLMGSDLILTGNNVPNIGDYSATFGGSGMPVYNDEWLEGFRVSKNPLFAQLLWYANGNSVEGLHYDIFTKDPESPQSDIEAAIEEHGELELSKSSIATGYGFAALRGGVMYDKVTSQTRTNTMRDWWMYFGGAATTHKHMDALNLGIDAFGMELAPDLGYFSSSGGAGTSQGDNWIESTLSHNTVLVNDKPQVRIKQAGYPYHFDDAGSVKLMDVDAPQTYPGVTDTYRRTIISVDVDDTVSYALDFFRIVGGDEHLYSFHTQSEESVIEGVKLIAQPKGTYAGIDVPFGEDIEYTATNGFNWLANVERASAPETGEFSIDFKIKDYQKVLRGNRNLHVKLTQLNGFEISEVARADGQPVQHKVNPEWIDYLLVRRSGKDLDTLFTSVIEPYEDESKINKLSRVDVARKDGKALRLDEPVAAIKVELKNGRIDYVVYSADNLVAYTIKDVDNDVSFDFTGFVGVYSVNSEDVTDVVRTYLHDGETLGTAHENVASAVTGEVVSFTKTLEFENFIEVTMEESIDPQTLVGRMIVIDNDGVQNGSYIIKSAEREGDNVLIGTGDVTLIRSLTEDGSDYVMNIAEGDKYRIPLTYATDNAPEIAVSGTFTTSAGSSIKIPLNVTSDREYTLIGASLPRGMSLNAETGVLTWKPDSSQVGENHVAVTVDNGVLSNTVHFTVTVYGSTTGDKNGNEETPSTGDSGGSAGGGGGGGAAPTDTPDDATDTDKTDTSGESGEDEKSEGNTDNTGTENSSLRFTDLANHAWASDAIGALAAEGIIKGTSETTFAPAANITRADFALLLVRAFELESDNSENFADVSASDYFATELAVARNTGIVNGIGDNKYAPRNHITRQDMMVIVYRALEKLNVGLGVHDEPQYSDFANVADYAKDAVSALVNAGLVNGKSGRIAPTDYTTRAEVAVLIKRILDYVK